MAPLQATPGTDGAGQAAAAALAKLASHMDIGWDLDGTLIGHPASPLLHRFIRAHRRMRHVLITFRTRRRHADPWSDLRAYQDAPRPEAFADVVFLDEAAAEIVSRIEQSARWLWRRPDPEQLLHLEWKGRVCREQGLTALVDDKPRMVAPGCRRYGIDLFHPQDFLPA